MIICKKSHPKFLDRIKKDLVIRLLKMLKKCQKSSSQEKIVEDNLIN